MPKVITLTNSALLSTLSNPEVAKAFPGLKKARKRATRRRAGCCGGRRRHEQDAAVNQIKLAISAWPAGDKQKLKQLLNAKKLRMYVGKQMLEF